ncbi:MAG: hypothetical protein KJ906_00605 [Nanoarchaeota archaeon]|nr:hypothetical protein [Nanoarchaeota archaeon]
MKKILFVILDGAGDGLRKGTSLEVAHKPILNEYTKLGFAGLLENTSGKHPDSGTSIFQLLGYPLVDYPGRGYLDAMGIGLLPKPHTLYMRANFATVKKEVKEVARGQFKPVYIVTDRRAGRDETGLKEIANDISEINIEGFNVKFYKSLAHRGILTISNYNVSKDITGTDAGQVENDLSEITAIKGDTNSHKTAAILNKWLDQVAKLLEEHLVNKNRKIPANYILLRGPSFYNIEKTFKEKHGLVGAIIAKSPVVRGIGKHFEMDVIDVVGATGTMQTDLKAKTLAALEALRDHDFVVLHILAPDIAGHDMVVRTKAGIIEKIDNEVFGRIKEYVDFDKTILCVTSDHITSVFSGNHEGGKFPFMIYTNGIESNNLDGYYEMVCKKGPMIDISEWMELIMKYR